MGWEDFKFFEQDFGSDFKKDVAQHDSSLLTFDVMNPLYSFDSTNEANRVEWFRTHRQILVDMCTRVMALIGFAPAIESIESDHQLAQNVFTPSDELIQSATADTLHKQAQEYYRSLIKPQLDNKQREVYTALSTEPSVSDRVASEQRIRLADQPYLVVLLKALAPLHAQLAHVRNALTEDLMIFRVLKTCQQMSTQSQRQPLAGRSFQSAVAAEVKAKEDEESSELLQFVRRLINLNILIHFVIEMHFLSRPLTYEEITRWVKRFFPAKTREPLLFLWDVLYRMKLSLPSNSVPEFDGTASAFNIKWMKTLGIPGKRESKDTLVALYPAMFDPIGQQLDRLCLILDNPSLNANVQLIVSALRLIPADQRKFVIKQKDSDSAVSIGDEAELEKESKRPSKKSKGSVPAGTITAYNKITQFFGWPIPSDTEIGATYNDWHADPTEIDSMFFYRSNGPDSDEFDGVDAVNFFMFPIFRELSLNHDEVVHVANSRRVSYRLIVLHCDKSQFVPTLKHMHEFRNDSDKSGGLQMTRVESIWLGLDTTLLGSLGLPSRQAQEAKDGAPSTFEMDIGSSSLPSFPDDGAFVSRGKLRSFAWSMADSSEIKQILFNKRWGTFFRRVMASDMWRMVTRRIMSLGFQYLLFKQHPRLYRLGNLSATPAAQAASILAPAQPWDVANGRTGTGTGTGYINFQTFVARVLTTDCAIVLDGFYGSLDDYLFLDWQYQTARQNQTYKKGFQSRYPDPSLAESVDSSNTTTALSSRPPQPKPSYPSVIRFFIDPDTKVRMAYRDPCLPFFFANTVGEGDFLPAFYCDRMQIWCQTAPSVRDIVTTQLKQFISLDRFQIAYGVSVMDISDVTKHIEVVPVPYSERTAYTVTSFAYDSDLIANLVFYVKYYSAFFLLEVQFDNPFTVDALVEDTTGVVRKSVQTTKVAPKTDVYGLNFQICFAFHRKGFWDINGICDMVSNQTRMSQRVPLSNRNAPKEPFLASHFAPGAWNMETYFLMHMLDKTDYVPVSRVYRRTMQKYRDFLCSPVMDTTPFFGNIDTDDAALGKKKAGSKKKAKTTEGLPPDLFQKPFMQINIVSQQTMALPNSSKLVQNKTLQTPLIDFSPGMFESFWTFLRRGSGDNPETLRIMQPDMPLSKESAALIYRRCLYFMCVILFTHKAGTIGTKLWREYNRNWKTMSLTIANGKSVFGWRYDEQANVIRACNHISQIWYQEGDGSYGMSLRPRGTGDTKPLSILQSEVESKGAQPNGPAQTALLREAQSAPLKTLPVVARDVFSAPTVGRSEMADDDDVVVIGSLSSAAAKQKRKAPTSTNAVPTLTQTTLPFANQQNTKAQPKLHNGHTNGIRFVSNRRNILNPATVRKDAKQKPDQRIHTHVRNETPSSQPKGVNAVASAVANDSNTATVGMSPTVREKLDQRNASLQRTVASSASSTVDGTVASNTRATTSASASLPQKTLNLDSTTRSERPASSTSLPSPDDIFKLLDAQQNLESMAHTKKSSKISITDLLG